MSFKFILTRDERLKFYEMFSAHCSTKFCRPNVPDILLFVGAQLPKRQGVCISSSDLSGLLCKPRMFPSNKSSEHKGGASLS